MSVLAGIGLFMLGSVTGMVVLLFMQGAHQGDKDGF